MEIDTIDLKEQDILAADNQPTPEVLSKYRLAGHFCSVAMKTVISRCAPGVNCKELCQLGDDTIFAQTAKVYQANERGIAEPTSINVNRCVRWYSPLPYEEGYVLCEGDVASVSLGVHIDGYSVLSTQTIRVQTIPSPTTGPIADAICALHFATKAIINLLSTGSTSQIELVLHEALDTFGLHIVEGSHLRRVRRFLIGQSTIQEKDSKIIEFGAPNSDFTVLPGEVYLLDLAISTGAGKVKPHPDLRSTIYTRSISPKAHTAFKLAATRNLFTTLTSNRQLYSVFPFTLRHHSEPARARLGVAELVTQNVLQPSPVLMEKDANAVVARRTLTVFVKKPGEVFVFGGGEGESKVMWARSEKSLRPGGELERGVKGEGVKVVELKRMEEEKMDVE